MGRFGQAPIGSLPTRSNRIWVSAARPRPTDQRKDTRSLIRRGQTCSDSNTIMLTVIRVPTAADRRLNTGVGEPLGVAHRQILGEFNWSSQHLDDEVLQCRDGNGEGQTGRVGLRCVRLVGRRQRGVRSSNGSGRRSRGGCRVRMPLCPVACRRPWVVVGSVRAVVCRRSAWRPDRLATCPLRSGKRSRSCELRAPGCVTLPVGSGEPRRLSRESDVATRRLGAAVWRIGRRLRSGTAPDVPRARRSPSWPRTIG